MNRLPVSSSNIVSIGYDSNSMILEVEFKNSVYRYYGIPEYIYTELMSAESHGKYLDANIKKAGYDYERIE
ncbi:MAG TPA: KTSC domain-containing protein [Pyrinomonadaceae bacterium]|nr:KTSC domain-containing protein [Pyrinomonadaceae bacterium]